MKKTTSGNAIKVFENKFKVEKAKFSFQDGFSFNVQHNAQRFHFPLYGRNTLNNFVLKFLCF